MNENVLAIVGVGPGLGRAIADRFAREGFAVALLARNEERVAGYAAALAERGIEARAFAADAADERSLAEAFAQVRGTLGPPSVLVYNAAVLRRAALTELTAEDMVAEFRVNVAGALVCMQQVVADMKQAQRGTILLTGGGLALTPYPQLGSVGVGKAGIRNLSQTMAQELEGDGVHVATVTICGFIQPDTHFAPERIAEHYWELHAQPREAWERERMYK